MLIKCKEDFSVNYLQQIKFSTFSRISGLEVDRTEMSIGFLPFHWKHHITEAES